MALFFTLLYLFASYLGPQTLFGSLADYHIQIIIAVITLIIALVTSKDSGLSQMPQSLALIGISIAVLFSMVFNGLTRGAFATLMDFLPNAFAYIVIVLSCKKKLHLQLVIYTIFFACAFTIFRGWVAQTTGDISSPYLLVQEGGTGLIFRLRGLSFISDPNDFSQVMVSLIPCLFFIWEKRRSFRNFVFVLLPTAVLIYGMYLTHSRGAIIASLVVVMLAARPRLGNIRSAIIGVVLFAISSAVGWSGGRDISVEAGADRLGAWATGLTLMRTHPLFGVGYERFGEFNDITAHNTIVVCAAELGFVGLFFWVMFVFPSVRDMIVAGKTNHKAFESTELDTEDQSYEDYLRSGKRRTEYSSRDSVAAVAALPVKSEKEVAQRNPHYALEEELDPLSNLAIGKFARILILSFAGYLTAGWFLSRAYAMTLFVYAGIAEVIYQMALSRGFVPPRMRVPRLLAISAYTSIGLIIFVYVALRIQHLMPH